MCNLEELIEEYPHDIAEYKLHGKQVYIVGVSHIIPFYYQHIDLFDELTHINDALVLEQPIGGEFWHSSFFNKLGNLANSYKKKVFVADPANIDSWYFDSYVVGSLGLGMMITGPISMFFGGSLLEGLIMAGIGTHLFSRAAPIQMLDETIYGFEEKKFRIIDYLSYDWLIDYRNLKIAEGIDKICRTENSVSSVVAFHGAAHTAGMEAYLKHPILRAKKIAYLPYEILGINCVREYSPRPIGWNLVNSY